MSSSSSSSSSSFSSSSSSSSSSDTLQRYWLGGAASDETNWNNANNWAATSGGTPGAGIPTALTDVFFDTNSTGYDCTATGAMVCKSLTADSNWNKNFSSGGFNLTSEGSVSFDHTGSLTLSNSTITINGDGDFHIGAIGTIALTNTCDIDFKGTGNIDIDKAHSTSSFRNVTLAYSGKTVSITGSQNLYFTNILTCQSGGAVVLTTSFYFNGSGTITPYVWNGVQPSGTGEVFYNPSGASTITISAYKSQTAGSGITCYDKTGVTVTYELAGNLEVSNFTFTSTSSSNGTLILNTNNYTIDLYQGTSNFGITQTSGTNTSTFTANFGSSTIYVRGNSFVVQTDSGAACNLNLQTSTWYIRISWTNTEQTVMDAGTSTVNFGSVNTTAASASPIITSVGQSFYNVVIHLYSNSSTFTLADAFSCNTLIHDSGAYGNFTSGGFNITAVSSINFDSTGTLTLTNSTITITGDGDFIISSLVGSTNVSDCDLDMKGTGTLTVGKANIYLKSYKIAYNGKNVTVAGSGANSGCKLLTLGDGGVSGTLNINSTLAIQVTTSNTPIIINGTPLITNSGSATFAVYAGTLTGDIITTLPSLTLSNSVNLLIDSLYSGGTTYTWTINQNGDIITATSGITFTIRNYRNADFRMIYNTNNYLITTSTFQIGSNYANASFTFNAGSSNIDISAWGNAYQTSSTRINWQTSQIFCSGTTWIYSLDMIIDSGTSILTLDGSTNCSITSNNKTFYTLIFSKTNNTYTITLVDALSCNTLTHNSGATGNFNAAGFSITSVSSISFDSTGTLTLGDITITGDGDFTITGNVGTLTSSTASLDIRGTGNFTFAKISGQFYNITFAYTGKVTTLQSFGSAVGNNGSGWNNVLTINGGTLTFGSTTAQLTYRGGSQLNPLVLVGSYVINGTSGTRGFYWLTACTDTTYTVNIPAITISGNVLFQLHTSNLGAKTVTFDLQGNIVSSGNVTLGPNNSLQTINLNINNNEITCITFQIGTNSTTCVQTVNFGSSIVTCSAFLMGNAVYTTGASNVNLQTSQWTVAGAFSYGANSTVNVGTSVVNITNTADITANSKGFATLVLNADTKTITWVDGDITISGLQIEPGTTVKFKEATTYTISNYTAGDWDGTAAKNVILKSTTDTNQWNLNAPSGVSVSYVNVRDSNATSGNTVIAWNGTNTNSGNNLNWLFTSSSSSSSSSQSSSSGTLSSSSSSSSSFSSSSSSSFSSSSSSSFSNSSSSSSSSFSSSSSSSESISFSSSSSSSFSSSSSSSSFSSSSSSSFSSSSSSSFSSSSSSSFSSSSSSSESFSSSSSSFSSSSFSSSSSSFSSSSSSFSSSSSSSGAMTYRTSEASWRALTLNMPTNSDAATIYIINNYENFFRQPLSNGVYKTVSKRLLEDNLIDREDLIFWWRKEWQKNGNIVEEPVMGSHREVFDHLRDATYVVKNNL